MKNEADELLIRKILEGEKDSFEILVLRYQKRIFNIIYRVTREESIVADLAQESFLKAFRGLDKFDFKASFYTWLVRIAINTSLNHVSSRPRNPLAGSEDLDSYAGTSAQFSEAGAWVSNPEHEAIRNEQAGSIRQAINSLAEDLRVSIMLREVEGLSYEEIAEVMECPVGTVRSRIHRARKELQDKLKPIL
ncbi:MAG: sigma-70 family RNA polymerase sigma factor [Proteobacteria bacterium]|nr:sigma-70 family RNA polymerase sigma factor [Pseudomonadota bacterium]